MYAARDERLERTVALKTMSSLAGDETARKRFWREARAAASVNHPNICQIYEIGEDGGTLFIAMELLEGESLADRLRRGPLRVSEAMPIGLGMLAALSALHARGIVHRDLKPSNVFLTPHGVKLLDFGLARPELDGTAGSAAELTHTGIGDRHAALHGARAGDGRARRRAQRSVRRRRHPVRDAGRPAGVRRPHGRRRPARDAARAAAGAHRLAGGRRRRSRDPPRARQATRRPAASADAMAEELRELPSVDGDDTPALAPARSRGSSCCRSGCCAPIPKPTSWPSACRTRSRRRCRGVGSLVVRSSATGGALRRRTPRTSRRWPPRPTSIAS